MLWRATCKHHPPQHPDARPAPRSAGAHRTWFHLLGLLIEQPSRGAVDSLPVEEQDAQLSQLAVAIEQFLQSATLGEFAKRLALLATFERHVQAQVRARATA